MCERFTRRRRVERERARARGGPLFHIEEQHACEVVCAGEDLCTPCSLGGWSGVRVDCGVARGQARAAREEEARLPITRATKGVHQGVEAEAARKPRLAPKGAEAEAAWEATSHLAPSGARQRRVFRGGPSKRQKVETSGDFLSSGTSERQHGFTVYADGPHQQGGGADRLPHLQTVSLAEFRVLPCRRRRP